MNDLIDRQAAIDAIDKYSVWVTYTQGDLQKDEAEFVENIIKQTKKAIQSMLIEDLPSAQPELSVKVERILDFLDTELHPIVSPDHWNVYSELHDMISMLPSAQLERKSGKWIEIKRSDINPLTGRCGVYVGCSECGAPIPTDSQLDYIDESEANYCINCGTDMRGEQDG